MTTTVSLPRPLSLRLPRTLLLLALMLVAALYLGLRAGTEHIDLLHAWNDPLQSTLLFRLRLPRVLMGCLVGASLAITGAALQALFRNPLADPYTLGVSGGGALGASIAIALGWSVRVGGTPIIFVMAFLGALSAVGLVHRIARTGAAALPGALLLSGVVLNMIAAAAVLTLQYVTDPSRALQILRWMIGSLDVVGYDTLTRLLVVLVPAWLALLFYSKPLHVLAMDEEVAATLGYDVRRCERVVHILCSVIVAGTVAAGGTIGFVGLVVPHAVRYLFGEDLRIVLPGSLLLGAAFLVLADALGRTGWVGTELPVGAITALLGGPAFLLLLRRRQQYSAL